MVIHITVLITAYNRKEYIKRAIDSVLNQTLNKDLYNIIVIKNFYDDEIDKYTKDHNIKSIVMDGTEGVYFIRGVKESSSDVISFLDDDDEFTMDKLLFIYEKFRENSHLIYLHNSYVQIDDTGKQLNINVSPNFEDIYIVNQNNKQILNALKKGGDFNLSSISIRKDILMRHFDYLKNIHHMTDTSLFYLCLSERGSMLLSSYSYTKIRFHVSTSRPDLSNKESLIISHRNNDITNTISFMAAYFADYSFYSLIKCMVYSNSLMKQLLSNKYAHLLKNSINFLFCSFKLNKKKRLGFLAIYIISFLVQNNNLFLYFYLKIEKNQRKKIKKAIKNHE